MLARLAGLFLLIATASCGDDATESRAAGGEAEAGGAGAAGAAERAEDGGPERAPPEPLPMGKAELGGYAYSRGPGRSDFQRALDAEREGDWAAAEAGCRQALLRDPGHLAAHWLLALSLASRGDFEAALAPLSAAVAGDWQRWGERALGDPALADFRGSRPGRRFLALAERYRGRFRRGVRDGLLVVGRRGKPWYPRRRGEVAINHRSEIYAYDLESGRYLRVSRTGGALVGFVRSPRAGELAYVAYRAVWLPREAAGRPPHLREVRIGTISLATAEMSTEETVLEDVRELDLFYGGAAGAPIPFARVTSAAGELSTYRLEPEEGRARPVGEEVQPLGRLLHVAYDRAELRQPTLEEIAADWDRDRAAGSFRLHRTRKTITVPGGESASRDSLRWSPEETHLSFATLPADACSEDPGERRATLFVVAAATGRLRPIATGDGPFESVWLDDHRLAYVDRSTEVPSARLVDVTTGGELAYLETRGGLSVLPSGVRCRPVRPQRGAPEPPEEEPGEPQTDAGGGGATR